jgi:hypothetical protein
LPAVALTQPTITRERAAKAARLARAHAGEALMKQSLGFLAQECLVRLAWTGRTHGGRFKGRTVTSVREGGCRALIGDLTPDSRSV